MIVLVIPWIAAVLVLLVMPVWMAVTQGDWSATAMTYLGWLGIGAVWYFGWLVFAVNAYRPPGRPWRWWG